MTRPGSDPRPVALVLGAAIRPDGTPSEALRRRAGTAARLWRDGRVRAIVASGGAKDGGVSEAQVIAALCRAAQVPAAHLHLEERATSTEENVVFAEPVLAALGAREILIVTDAWHGPRARLVARRRGLTARIVPAEGGARSLPAMLRGALREVPASLWYWIRGAGR